jgi:hypothetical protein
MALCVHISLLIWCHTAFYLHYGGTILEWTSTSFCTVLMEFYAILLEECHNILLEVVNLGILSLLWC